MTRDEQRKACIEAIAKAISDDCYPDEWIKEATAAFDSLHGLAQIIPMVPYVGGWLTNPPENKP